MYHGLSFAKDVENKEKDGKEKKKFHHGHHHRRNRALAKSLIKRKPHHCKR